MRAPVACVYLLARLLTRGRRQALDAEQRRVAHCTFPHFNELLAKAAAAPQSEWWKDVYKFSREVGVVLGRKEHGGSLPGSPLTQQQALKLACWELLVACFVDRGQVSNSLSHSLVRWLHLNDSAAADSSTCVQPTLQRVQQACASAPRPEEVPGYWSAAAQLVALGRYSCAVDLLRLHSVHAEWSLRKPSAAPAFSALDMAERLLLRAPHPGSPDAHVQTWRRALAEALTSPDIWERVGGTPTGDGVQALLRVLSAEEAALETYTSGWVELFVAKLCHSHPSMNAPQDLLRLAHACAARKGGAPERVPLQAMLLASLGLDAAECVRLCSEHLDAWFNAHAPELLAAAGPDAFELVRSPLPGGDGRSVAQWHRLDFAACCAASPALTYLAAEYCAAAGDIGAGALRELLLRASGAGNELQVQQLASVARRLGLVEVELLLCTGAGMAAEAAGNVGAAVAWFAQCSGGSLKLQQVAAQKLPREPWRAPDEQPALLRSMGAEAETATRGPLAFLRGFSKLRACVSAAQRQGALAVGDPTAADAAAAHEADAADTLRELLSTDGVPRARWSALLFAAVPLLEGLHCSLSAADADLLLARLEELELHAWDGAALTDDKEPAAEAQLEAVRLALARHAARCAV